MTGFEWSPALSLGIASIDAEHQRILFLMNRLRTAMLEDGGREAVKPVLDELTAYTEHHFAMEEGLFAELHYLDAVSHIAEHQELARRVATFRAALEQGGCVLPLELLNLMREWLARHIVETDGKYAAFFRARGIV